MPESQGGTSKIYLARELPISSKGIQNSHDVRLLDQTVQAVKDRSGIEGPIPLKIRVQSSLLQREIGTSFMNCITAGFPGNK